MLLSRHSSLCVSSRSRRTPPCKTYRIVNCSSRDVEIPEPNVSRPRWSPRTAVIRTLQFSLGLLLAHLSASVVMLSHEASLAEAKRQISELQIQVKYLENDNKRLQYDSIVAPVISSLGVGTFVYFTQRLSQLTRDVTDDETWQ